MANFYQVAHVINGLPRSNRVAVDATDPAEVAKEIVTVLASTFEVPATEVTVRSVSPEVLAVPKATEELEQKESGATVNSDGVSQEEAGDETLPQEEGSTEPPANKRTHKK